MKLKAIAGLFLVAVAALTSGYWMSASCSSRDRPGSLTGITQDAGPDAVIVTIDRSVRYQVIQGFGSSVRPFEDQHVFDRHKRPTGLTDTVVSPAQQNEILERLYLDLGLTRARVDFTIGFEPENDNGDPYSADHSKFKYDYLRDRHLFNFVQELRSRGVTIFPTTGTFEAWMTGYTDPAEIAEWILVRLRSWRDRGIEFPYYSVINEPGYRGGGLWSGELIRDVIKQLGPRLRAEGLQTALVIPDDWGPAQAYERSRVILSDNAARKYVGALAFHLYRGNESDLVAMTALGTKYKIPLWMTEYSLNDPHYWNELYGKDQIEPLDWANLIHDMIVTYNVAAVDYMMGFMGKWAAKTFPGAQLIVLQHEGSRYLGYSVTKPYYMMGQFSRFVRPGSRRIKAESSFGTVKASAYANEDDLTIVLINNAHVGRIVEVRLTPDFLPGAVMQQARTSDNEDWRTLDPIPIRASSFRAKLDPRSVTTFFTGRLEGVPLSNQVSPGQ